MGSKPDYYRILVRGWNLFTHIKERFGEDNIKLLSQLLTKSSRYSIGYDETFNILISKDMKKMLYAPLSDMPLHINDEDYVSSSIAEWRLKIGI